MGRVLRRHQDPGQKHDAERDQEGRDQDTLPAKQWRSQLAEGDIRCSFVNPGFRIYVFHALLPFPDTFRCSLMRMNRSLRMAQLSYILRDRCYVCAPIERVGHIFLEVCDEFFRHVNHVARLDARIFIHVFAF